MPRLLDLINGPEDLKEFTKSQLILLAAEIREELINTITINGGHLASNLGAVELTIALHRVFDSPRDKIIWDVGHQSYVHKLLTGRRERFSSIRQYQGLSGFTDPEESPHDAFISGHASTSISAGLGISIANRLANNRNHVVSVVGDGALGGGLAFEALNHAGHTEEKLIVVLNDNAMSISPSVGAVAKSLNKLRFNPRYRRAKREALRVTSRLLGSIRTNSIAKRVMNSIKGLLLPTLLWEELGFIYLGPIDGHKIEEIEKALIKARDFSDKPVFVHVLTTKGNGYVLAEHDPVGFHGIPPYQSKLSLPTYTEIFSQTMLRLLNDNPKIVAITAAMLEGTGLDAVKKRFPDRVFDVGICEQHAVTMAAGLATQGFIPIVAIYSTFLQRAYDQIIHDVCIPKLPVVFAIDRGGIVGDDGKTHHGHFDLSYLGCLPNMIIASPGDENEFQHLLYTATLAGQPMAIRYPRGNCLGVPLDTTLRRICIGTGNVVRQGEDVAILAIGHTLAPSIETANMLATNGVSCSVINAVFMKPLDRSLILNIANRMNNIVTVEENVIAGGFGSAVLSLLNEHSINNVNLKMLGLPDKFIEHGPQGLLRAKYGLTADEIVQYIYTSFPELALSHTL